MTLEEKYALALTTLREIAQRGKEGSIGTCYDDNGRFWEGFDAGLEDQGDTAQSCLKNLGET